MAVRRAISAYYIIFSTTDITMNPLQEYIGLVLSLCMLAGIVLIKPLFSEIKRSEEEARESKLKFQIFSDYTYDWEYWRNPDGSFAHISPSCERCTGYTADEFYKQPELLVEVVHQDDREDFREHLKSLESHTPHSIDFRIITKDGEERWVSHVCQAVFDDEGKWLGRRASNRDITERVNAETELEKHRDHLEEMVKQRTAELEAFTYSVSHDLRAPLRSIDGFSQVVMEDYSADLDEKALDYLRKVRAATERMALMIDDLLSLSRATQTEVVKSDIDLSELAEEVVQFLRDKDPKRKASIKIQKYMTARTDPVLLRIALENLFGNAWKFTAGRTVAEIEFDCSQDKDELLFHVRDNGAGFEMRYADKLFTPFQRLHSQEEFPGTGIGLATVARIIHRLGGQVWAEGEKDKGTTIGFSLPIQ
ncbi:MAG: ATP-binding protein [Actinomycetota bacterium]